MTILFKLLLLLGIHLYAVGEGSTEAIMWDNVKKSASTKKLVNDGKYHFLRLLEMLGLLIIALSMIIFVEVNPGWPTTLWYIVAGVYMMFVAYRVAFVIVRKQGIHNVLPEWCYTLWVPMIDKEINIPYPFPGRGREAVILYVVIVLLFLII